VARNEEEVPVVLSALADTRYKAAIPTDGYVFVWFISSIHCHLAYVIKTIKITCFMEGNKTDFSCWVCHAVGHLIVIPALNGESWLLKPTNSNTHEKDVTLD
jgi:hypothetical protein